MHIDSKHMKAIVLILTFTIVGLACGLMIYNKINTKKEQPQPQKIKEVGFQSKTVKDQILSTLDKGEKITEKVIEDTYEIAVPKSQEPTDAIIQDLKKLNNLETLYWEWRSDSDFELLNQLGDMKNLENITIHNYTKSDVSEFNRITSVKTLGFEKGKTSKVSCLEGLDQLTNLTGIVIDGYELKDLNEIAKLNELTSFTMFSSKLAVNKKLTNSNDHLTTLIIRSTSLDSLDFLSSFPNITELEVCKCKVNNLDAISKLHNVEKLSLNSSTVNNFSFLESLTKVKRLDLEDTNFTDASVLKSYKNLESLNITYTKVEDISMLNDLSNLQELWLHGSLIKDISAFKENKHLQIDIADDLEKDKKLEEFGQSINLFKENKDILNDTAAKIKNKMKPCFGSSWKITMNEQQITDSKFGFLTDDEDLKEKLEKLASDNFITEIEFNVENLEIRYAINPDKRNGQKCYFIYSLENNPKNKAYTQLADYWYCYVKGEN